MTVGLPSLGHIVAAARRTAQRFPLVLAAGVVAAIAGILIVHTEGDDKAQIRLVVAALLGIGLNFGLAVAAERRARSRAGYWMLSASGLAIIAAFFYLWPRWTEPQQGMRLVQLTAAVHFFIAFAPFMRRGEERAFWQYNRILFLRFLVAALYAAVLWLGLSGALAALDKLFGVAIEGQAYIRLWMVMTFVFHPWFFLSGVPEDLGALQDDTTYPRGLRVFTQYVLVPIVVIYLVILTAYLAKVVVTREWPSGWIGFLVSGVAGVGILSWLLVHPLEEREEHAWVKTFTRGFYIALMPAVVMLWLAIWQRVAQYGMTERRYFLLVLSLWLGAIAAYYTFSRSRSIKVIPATLCALAIVTLAGPWGAYSVSRWSQTRRLEQVFVRNGMLADGTLTPATRAVSDSDATAIRSGLVYLIEGHGTRAIDRWMTDTLRRQARIVPAAVVRNPEIATRNIMNAVNVTYRPRGYGGHAAMFSHSIGGRRGGVVDITGYTVAVDVSLHSGADSVVVSEAVAIRLSADSTALLVTRRGVPVLTVPLLPMLDSIGTRPTRSWQVSEQRMRVVHREGDAAALVRFTGISGLDRNPRRVTALSGTAYLRLP
jgi:hypothetical protein